jgi:putative ABC transport system permease protein
VNGGAVVKAAGSGVLRRPVQTIVIFCVVTAGAAAGVLGLSLATSANVQFLGAFARAHGADLAVTFDSATVTRAELAATGHLAGVTRVSGPFGETAVFFAGSGPTFRKGRPESPPGSARTSKGTPGSAPAQVRNGAGRSAAPAGIPQLPTNPQAGTPSTGLAVVGRTSPSGPLDDISLQAGRWATKSGEIDIDPGRTKAAIGSVVSVGSAPGDPKLTVVGWASSVTEDDEAWVAPNQLAALRAKGAPVQDEMLYDFTSASDAAEVAADLAEITRALPAGAVADSISWLDTGGSIAQEQSINTPFVVAFAIVALVLAVLITANVVSAAVVAGYRRIGVLKSIGFTPLQVAATYLAQIGLPALAGVIIGTILGVQWVLPKLNAGPFAAEPVPLWIEIVVPVGMLALTGLAALVPALRAGRLSATAAIAAGQAPRAGHGFAALRLAGRVRLPRPVTMGLAAPITRPARSAVTLAAIGFGLAAVVVATGLNASLAKINAGANQWKNAELIAPGRGGPARQAFTPAQEKAVAAVLRAQPGTTSFLTIASAAVSVAGRRLSVDAYSGDAAGLGWDVTAGTWLTGKGQVVVNTSEAGTATLSVGQVVRMVADGGTVTARIVGEVYAPGPALGALLTSQQTFARAGVHLPVIRFEAATTAAQGPAQNKYQQTLSQRLGSAYNVSAIGVGIGGVGLFGLVDTSLARLLTIMIAILAALGVLNSVLMVTRERVHDLGVFKAVGMTPRQTVTMVTCWAVVRAILAAVIALPVGMRLQAVVVHAITADQASGLGAPTAPGGVVDVYTVGGLALLALAGLIIAVIGALGPAMWAALTSTTTTLRAE